MRSALLSALCGFALFAAGCGQPAGGAAPAGAATDAKGTDAPPVLLLAPEDVRTVQRGGNGGGPVVTGSLQPGKRADLRAEVAAVVTQVLKDNGERVQRGDLLLRLDDTSIRESLQSARAGERAAVQAFEQAQRQVERLKTLQAQGMTSAQALDDAEGRRNAAQSELAAARSRVVAAQQQLRRTEVRAPFEGVVSERKASVGDTAQVGKELLKVIDPRSMRFEGLVAADRLADIAAGQAVTFRVNGVDGVEFRGTVQRVDAAADAITRQVEVMIGFDDPARAPKVAGLYAEGQIVGAGGRAGGAALPPPMLPDGAIQRSGDAAFVWRVGKDGRLARVAVQLGERDARTGEFPLQPTPGGLAEGDTILRNPGSALVDGQKAEFAANAAKAPPAAGK